MKKSKNMVAAQRQNFVACIGFNSLCDFNKAVGLLKKTNYCVIDNKVNTDKRLTKIQNEMLEPLTNRETETLEHLSKGLSYLETAKVMGCGLSTVQTHVKRIYCKLNTHSKTEAIYEAIQMGIIDLTPYPKKL